MGVIKPDCYFAAREGKINSFTTINELHGETDILYTIPGRRTDRNQDA